MIITVMMITFVSLPTMYGIKGLGFSLSIVDIDISHSTLNVRKPQKMRFGSLDSVGNVEPNGVANLSWTGWVICKESS